MPGPLTREAKRRCLRKWAEERAGTCDGQLEPAVGVWRPDPEILPLCDAVNELDGLVTTHSCSGHASQRFPNGRAYLSLWPSAVWDFALSARVKDLRALPGMHGAWRSEDGRWTLSFSGLGSWPSDKPAEFGRRSLARSAAAILEFLRAAAGAGAGWD